jgi:hypothetical protein
MLSLLQPKVILKKNKIMKKLFLITVLVFLAKTVDGQKSMIIFAPYNFGANLGEPHEISRLQLDCNCFVDNSSLWSVNGDSIIYCNVLGSWVMKNKDIWSCLKCDSSSVINFTFPKTIMLNSIEFDIVWMKDKIINNKKVSVFELQSNIVTISTQSYYYFDNIEGIVGYEVDGDLYMRNY